MIYSDDWEILGGERIRRWPNEHDERDIDVKVYSWRGISIGAKHVYVTVEEEPNQFWSESRNDWVEISQDSSKKGYCLRADCMSGDEANELARFFVSMIKKANPKQPYKVYWNLEDDDASD